jgi:hypothetical protein
VSELLRDLDLVLGLDEEPIVLVGLVEEDVLQRKHLSGVGLADAVDLTGRTASDVLEDSVTLDVVGFFHGGAGHGSDDAGMAERFCKIELHPGGGAI